MSSILALATQTPQYQATNKEFTKFMINVFNLEGRRKDFLEALVNRSMIESRYSCIPDFILPQDQWEFFPKAFPEVPVGTKERNEVYKIHAPILSEQVARKAIEEWGGNVADITHVISVSCTGMMAPGLEFLLIDSLGLSREVQRFGINFMGCFGAFRGLAAARAFAKLDKKNRVLVVCCELCTLHIQREQTAQNMVSHTLFSDGAAAVIVGDEPTENEQELWTIEKFGAHAFEDSLDQMTWNIGDDGFIMTLLPKVPETIQQGIYSFAEGLLSSAPFQEYAWAIHPGGKAIIKGIEQACDLIPAQTVSSWNVLRDYGNMSSATFLFVLDELRKNIGDYQDVIGLGFGPGLSVEGVVLGRGRDV